MSSFRRSSNRLAIGLAVLAAGCAPGQPAGGSPAIPEIAGRTAGTPQSCVPSDRQTSLRIIDERTALYGGGPRTVWVNRLKSDCPGADRMDILVAQPTGAQYCNGDQVRVLDPLTQVPGPVCILGDFVPYSR